MMKQFFDMKKLIYVIIVFGITEIIVFRSPGCTTYSKDVLNYTPNMPCVPSGDLSQLTCKSAEGLVKMKNSQYKFKHPENKTPKFFKQGWPFNKGFKQVEIESSSPTPIRLNAMHGLSCRLDSYCKCGIDSSIYRIGCYKKICCSIKKRLRLFKKV
jgi:hypothetical protein